MTNLMDKPHVKNHRWFKNLKADSAAKEKRLAKHAQSLDLGDSTGKPNLSDMFSSANRLGLLNNSKKLPDLIKTAILTAREAIDQFDFPISPSISYLNVKNVKTAGTTDDVLSGTIILQCKFATVGGLKQTFDIPVQVVAGKVLPPSVVKFNGRDIVLAQSSVNAMVQRASSYELIPVRQQFSAPLTRDERESATELRNEIGYQAREGIGPVSTIRRTYKKAQSELDDAARLYQEYLPGGQSTALEWVLDSYPNLTKKQLSQIMHWEFEKDSESDLTDKITPNEPMADMDDAKKYQNPPLRARKAQNEFLVTDSSPSLDSDDADSDLIKAVKDWDSEKVKELVSSGKISVGEWEKAMTLATTYGMDDVKRQLIRYRTKALPESGKFLYKDVDENTEEDSDIDLNHWAKKAQGKEKVEIVEFDLDGNPESPITVIEVYSDDTPWDKKFVSIGNEGSDGLLESALGEWQEYQMDKEWDQGIVEEIKEELGPEAEENDLYEAYFEAVTQNWSYHEWNYANLSEAKQDSENPYVKDVVEYMNEAMDDGVDDSPVIAKKSQILPQGENEDATPASGEMIGPPLFFPDDEDKGRDDFDETLIGRIFQWHGGQGTAEYSLGSTWNAGKSVPKELVQEVMDSFEAMSANPKYADQAEELAKLADDLSLVLSYPEEMCYTPEKEARVASMGTAVPGGYEKVKELMDKAQDEGKDTFPRSWIHVLRNYILEVVATASQDSWLTHLVNDGYVLNPYGSNNRGREKTAQMGSSDLSYDEIVRRITENGSDVNFFENKLYDIAARLGKPDPNASNALVQFATKFVDKSPISRDLIEGALHSLDNLIDDEQAFAESEGRLDSEEQEESNAEMVWVHQTLDEVLNEGFDKGAQVEDEWNDEVVMDEPESHIYDGTKTPMEPGDSVKFQGHDGAIRGTIVEVNKAAGNAIIKAKGYEYRVALEDIQPLNSTFKKMYANNCIRLLPPEKKYAQIFNNLTKDPSIDDPWAATWDARDKDIHSGPKETKNKDVKPIVKGYGKKSHTPEVTEQERGLAKEPIDQDEITNLLRKKKPRPVELDEEGNEYPDPFEKMLEYTAPQGWNPYTTNVHGQGTK